MPINFIGDGQVEVEVLHADCTHEFVFDERQNCLPEKPLQRSKKECDPVIEHPVVKPHCSGGGGPSAATPVSSPPGLVWVSSLSLKSLHLQLLRQECSRLWSLTPTTLFPSCMPESTKIIEYVQGDGRVGRIKQTNFPEGSHFKYLKHNIDVVNVTKHECKYTYEGDVLLGKAVESITYEVNFEASGAGCVCKTISHFHVKEGIELMEEDIKAGKDKALRMYKLVEEYLQFNTFFFYLMF